MASLPPGQGSMDTVLTPRQSEVFELVASGMSNKRIAAETGMAVKTVETHLAAIADRLPGDGRPRQKIIRAYHTALTAA